MNKIEELTTEEILWMAIRDIENGNAKFIEEDPIDGWLQGRNKKINKMNISQQSAKYNFKNNNKPISRPTIDKYKDIVSYIEIKTIKKGSIEELKEELKNLKHDNLILKDVIIELKEKSECLAFQNYTLLEKNKNLANIVDNNKKNLKIIK
jgi:hypothetical protein